MRFYLVSVIIPTYNHGHCLKTAITSVLNQEYKNIELIIIDDASTDHTETLIHSYSDSRIRYRRHPVNQKVAKARNSGLTLARGEFIAFLDADDFWLPKKLSRQLEIFETISKTDFVFTNGFNHDDQHFIFTPTPPSGFISTQKNHWPLKGICPFTPTWLFRKNIITKIGLFDDTHFPEHEEDGDFFVRTALASFNIYFLNEPLVFFNTNDRSTEPKVLKAKEMFFQKHRSNMSLDKEYAWIFLKTLGKDYLKNNMKQKARYYLFKALQHRPWSSATWSKFLRTFFSFADE